MAPSVLVPAFLGWLFTYYNSKKTDERKAQIDRINDQVRQHSPDGTVEGFVKALQSHPEGPEGEAYRRWMRVVLQPLNEKAADTIVKHVDLLRTPYIDPLLLQLVAHMATNKIILKRWEEGNVREWSAITYPNQLLEYVTSEFKQIKRKQAQLLGLRQHDGLAGGGTEEERREANRLDPAPPRPPRAKL